ncbi:MAG TPA: putative glycoside hydrolase, partial [Longimicrobiaceae bacterium]|nr:putative glycoside hydrolase [Longimicrobiaceae bacterium]
MPNLYVRRSALAAALALLAACGGSEAGARSPDGAGEKGKVNGGETAAADSAARPAPARSPRDEAPPILRGLYLNAYAAGSPNRLPKLLRMADETEINAFVVDVKDEKGIRYETQLPLQKQLAQPGEVTIENLRTFIDTLRAHKIYSIARIVIFKDPILSKAQPDWSVRRPGGGLWVDKAGNTWVSP